MGVGGQRHAPAAFTPGKDPVPMVQEAGWAPGPVWVDAENLAPPEFDPRTFQLVASRYTDYAIPAHVTPLKCGRYGSTLRQNLLWLYSVWKSKDKFAASLLRL